MGRMTQPVSPGDLRVSDVERLAVQERLRRAVADGQLDLPKFDERLTGVWAARTRRDLVALTRDLPAEPPPVQPASPSPRRVFTDTSGGTAMRVLSIVWVCALVVNVVVWFLVSVSVGAFVHPWPVWLAPAGAALVVLYVTGVGRPPLRRGRWAP